MRKIKGESDNRPVHGHNIHCNSWFLLKISYFAVLIDNEKDANFNTFGLLSIKQHVLRCYIPETYQKAQCFVSTHGCSKFFINFRRVYVRKGMVFFSAFEEYKVPTTFRTIFIKQWRKRRKFYHFASYCFTLDDLRAKKIPRFETFIWKRNEGCTSLVLVLFIRNILLNNNSVFAILEEKDPSVPS